MSKSYLPPDGFLQEVIGAVRSFGKPEQKPAKLNKPHFMNDLLKEGGLRALIQERNLNLPAAIFCLKKLQEFEGQYATLKEPWQRIWEECKA